MYRGQITAMLQKRADYNPTSGPLTNLLVPQGRQILMKALS